MVGRGWCCERCCEILYVGYRDSSIERIVGNSERSLANCEKKTVHPANKQSVVLRTKNKSMYVYISSKEKMPRVFSYIHIIVILFSLFVSILYYRYVFINMETWSDAKTFFILIYKQPHLIVQAVRKLHYRCVFFTSRSIWQNINTTYIIIVYIDLRDLLKIIYFN